MRKRTVDQLRCDRRPVAALITIKALLLLSLLLLPAFAAEDGLKVYQDREGDLFLVLEHRYFKPSLEGTTVERLMTKCMCSSLFKKKRQKSASYVGYSFHHNDTCTLLTTSDPAGSLDQYIRPGTASETGDWEASNYESGARLVVKAPSLGQMGTDGLLYFASPNANNLDGCRAYCSQYAGFRLAQAKTTLAMTNLRLHGHIYIDLSSNETPPLPSTLIWGDGTPLDPSFLRTDIGEPVLNDQATAFVMWSSPVDSSVRVIDDCSPAVCALPCLCQGNFANVPW